MKRMASLTVAALAVTAMGLSSVTASAKTNKASNDTFVATLNYKKVSSTAHFNKTYSKFKLYNHVPNSNYKNIKSTSWKKSGLNLKKITKNPVKINMMASQGTQYNWYRFSTAKKSGNKTVKTNYWVYGQALKENSIY